MVNCAYDTRGKATVTQVCDLASSTTIIRNYHKMRLTIREWNLISYI